MNRTSLATQDACACVPANGHDVKPTETASQIALYRIENMDRPTVEALIRDGLSGFAGVHALDFNLMQRTLGVHHSLCDPAPIDAALKALGMNVQPVGGSAGQDADRVVYRIEKMDCPTEEALIRKRLAKLPGVKGLEFNLVQRKLTVRHSLADLAPIESALTAIGMLGERQTNAAESTTVLAIAKVDCPTEEALIRDKLAGISGILAMDFNLVTRTLTLRHAPDALPRALEALESLDLGATVTSAEASGLAPQTAVTSKQRYRYWLLALSGVCAVLAEVASWITDGNHWSVMTLALIAILTGGLTTYKKGWIAVRNLNLNINALMSIAVTGAMLIGHWPEAAMVMFLFTVAELIEAKSLDRARNAIRGLLDLAPETATVQRADGSWQETPANAVALQALVRVKPGERVALDGEIVSGRSTINQAPITGESLPVEKAPGDKVFAGTINESGSFDFRVTARATDSTLARIIHAVESAQGSRAPTQRFVDRFARVYTPAVLMLAVLVALVPPLAFDGEWMTWIYRALVMLVVACPCALVISTPVTIVSALAAAARKGILIKGGVYLEGGRKLSVLALDKTGTITHGKPEQTEVIALMPDEAKLRRVAASLAARSDHPVSQAIARAAKKDGVGLTEVRDFSAIPGYGVRGNVEGTEYHLCNLRWVNEHIGALAADFQSQLDTLERQGKTLALLARAREVLGAFAVADTVKESSRKAIAELHKLGVRTLMLTGDNPHTAEAIAKQVGIDEAQGHQLPEDKLKAIETEIGAGRFVGMVGDGINDAPALARADIGFAMGAAGTDTAIETADVALMDDDLRKIPKFIGISRRTAQVLTQNIVFALVVKAVFLVLTFTGHATMWMAVFADMGASLIVVLNGLRLLRR